MIELESDHVICEQGDVLHARAVYALKLFNVRMAEFAVRLLLRWRSGEVKRLAENDQAGASGGMRVDGDDDDDEEEEEDGDASDDDS